MVITPIVFYSCYSGLVGYLESNGPTSPHHCKRVPRKIKSNVMDGEFGKRGEAAGNMVHAKYQRAKHQANRRPEL